MSGRRPNMHLVPALGHFLGDLIGIIADAAQFGRILARDDMPLHKVLPLSQHFPRNAPTTSRSMVAILSEIRLVLRSY